MEKRFGRWCDQNEEVKCWYENFVKRKTEVNIDWFNLCRKGVIKFDPKFIIPVEKRDIVKMWWDGSEWEESFNDFVILETFCCRIYEPEKECVSGLNIIEFMSDYEYGFEYEDIEDFIDKCEMMFEESLSYYLTSYIEWVSNSEQTTPLTRVMNRVLKNINYNLKEKIKDWGYKNWNSLDTLEKICGVKELYIGDNHFIGFSNNLIKIEDELLNDFIEINYI